MFNKTLSQFENKNILIVGLAREGLSSTEFLLKNLENAQIKITDSKNLDELDEKWTSLLKENANLELISASEVKNEKFDFIFRAPGIHLDILQKKYQPNQEAVITSNTQLFFDLTNSLKPAGTVPTGSNPATTTGTILVIGVTGTKGKSTTTSQIHHLLQKTSKEINWQNLNNPQIHLGGNIGVPPLRLLENNPQPKNDIFVLELSSHQLTDLKDSPQIAIIQDISPDHLDYYATFEEYMEAKTTISKHQLGSDLVIYNSDSKTATEMAKLSPGEKTPFSQTNESLINLIKSAPSPLVGEHNLYNTLPGVIIAQRLGISEKAIKGALSTFKSVSHRLELVKTTRGIKFYNDSAATAPEATMAGIRAFEESPLILIIGGVDKGVPLEELAQVVLDSNIKFVVFFPVTGEKILDTMRQIDAHHSLISNNQFASSMEEAVEIATKHARSGDVVLLSPATSSFNMFKSYEERGNQFRELAQKQTA
jgi:UDP-N-acetylmuramoylalanine--D-glutamate ligase